MSNNGNYQGTEYLLFALLMIPIIIFIYLFSISNYTSELNMISFKQEVVVGKGYTVSVISDSDNNISSNSLLEISSGKPCYLILNQYQTEKILKSQSCEFDVLVNLGDTIYVEEVGEKNQEITFSISNESSVVKLEAKNSTTLWLVTIMCIFYAIFIFYLIVA